MADVLKLRMLHVMGYHGMLGWSVRVLGEGTVFVFIVVVVAAVLLAHEVLGTLVFVCAAILGDLLVPWRLAHLSIPGGQWGCLHIGSGQLSR